MQDKNFNKLKLKVNDTYEKYEKLAKTETSDDSDVKDKAYLDTKISKIEHQISTMQKEYNGIKLHSNKQSGKEILIEKVVETNIQTLYDKGSFDNFSNRYEVLRNHIFVVEVKESNRPTLEEKMQSFNDFFHKFSLKNKTTSNRKKYNKPFHLCFLMM